MRRATTPRAFTLIEVLVVIAIIALLIAIAVPAIQRIRETANRMVCTSNLRQVGLAIQSFHAERQVFPASGWTMAGPGNPNGKFVGWRVLIFPYLEKDAIRERYDLTLNWWEGTNLLLAGDSVKTLQCPTVSERAAVFSAVAKPPRPAMNFPVALAPTDYEALMGVQPSVDPVRYASPAKNRSVMFRNSRVRMGDISDGASNTIIVVECAARPLVYRKRQPIPHLSNDQGQGWIDSEGPFSLDGASADGSVVGQGPIATPYVMNVTNENEPYSFHPGGCNFLFADGSVRFIRDTVRLADFAGLCTRAGGEPVSLPE
jgi:prepilin-type N-terminal cleavage/methylation domain-containing protein/prepilin-type processing-associated H-X9-DG protein